ncbi:hypothetical protein DAPPUDRAFT_321974 [Daphnia pulex]|uniref:Uncharacterized protein n=1 Tax=Daphnia pulex TaxID=6669 RepID=E9GUS1_DAPPU|nr:hypothetical protein DAPPUDRAFT_321974 [Daphnia pulex]|eukprot:EFX76785.1 hypothetical protein DAPPUDRAFT_321974 [Daphnia pulex]
MEETEIVSYIGKLNSLIAINVSTRRKLELERECLEVVESRVRSKEAQLEALHLKAASADSSKKTDSNANRANTYPLKRSNPLGNASLAKKLKVESGESVSGISKTIKQNLSVGAENSHNVGQVKEDRKAALEKNLQKTESWPYNLSLKRRNSLGNDSDAKESKLKES